MTVRHVPPGQGGRTPHQSIVPALLAKEEQYCFVSSSFAVFIARIVRSVGCAMAAAGGIVRYLKDGWRVQWSYFRRCNTNCCYGPVLCRSVAIPVHVTVQCVSAT